MNRNPNPLDLSDIELSGKEKTVELIAKSIHGAWADTRIKNGWRYGEAYDPKKKLHPCLVEYEQLSDEEKDIDRVTVAQTIRALLELGYKIERNDKE